MAGISFHGVKAIVVDDVAKLRSGGLTRTIVIYDEDGVCHQIDVYCAGGTKDRLGIRHTGDVVALRQREAEKLFVKI
jgi:hypothetical protein